MSGTCSLSSSSFYRRHRVLYVFRAYLSNYKDSNQSAFTFRFWLTCVFYDRLHHYWKMKNDGVYCFYDCESASITSYLLLLAEITS